jgi:y4mF family transcriptional regulator
MNKKSDKMTSNEIAEIVRYYRKQSDLTQYELAKLAGIGKTAVFDIEKAKQTVQLKTLLSVLNILNIQMKLEPPFPRVMEL